MTSASHASDVLPFTVHLSAKCPGATPSTFRLNASSSHGAAFTKAAPLDTPKKSGEIPVTLGGRSVPSCALGVQVTGMVQPTLMVRSASTPGQPPKAPIFTTAIRLSPAPGEGLGTLPGPLTWLLLFSWPPTYRFVQAIPTAASTHATATSPSHCR